MLNYLLLINIVLLVVSITFIYKWYKGRKYNQQLFIRSWELELALMEIYEDCPEEVQGKISNILINIKPL